jgi:arylsulfatase A-like enzyme
MQLARSFHGNPYFRVSITLATLAFAMEVNVHGQGPAPSAPADKPNIVFILADDFSMNLLPSMVSSSYGGLQSMVNDGTTFANFFVGDSLCCPSRSTIFTGKYPHNSGVFTNTWAPDKGLTDGGFGAFMNNNDQAHTFALALHGATPPYTTAMLGKYLNGYLPWDNAMFQNKRYNIPSILKNDWGWDTWGVAGNGYPEFIYDLFQSPPGAVHHYGIDPEDYLTDVVSGLAQDFIKKNKDPFFIEIATFAPHEPYRPAYRDETAFPGARVPRTAAYDARPDANAPDWIKDVPPLEQQEKGAMDDDFRLRAQCTLAIDKMISDIRATLKGPGVQHQTINQIAQTVDLAPTFTDIGGNSSPAEPDGHSLVPLLRGQTPPDDPADPDVEKHEKESGDARPPNYEALRSATYLYVEYSNAAPITSVSSTATDATFQVTNTPHGRDEGLDRGPQPATIQPRQSDGDGGRQDAVHHSWHLHSDRQHACDRDGDRRCGWSQRVRLLRSRPGERRVRSVRTQKCV